MSSHGAIRESESKTSPTSRLWKLGSSGTRGEIIDQVLVKKELINIFIDQDAKTKKDGCGTGMRGTADCYGNLSQFWKEGAASGKKLHKGG